MSTTKNKKQIRFYLPGMFNFLGERGLYPAISITGDNCQLKCAHCQGKILHDMIPATNPDTLVEVCLKLAKQGNIGCLISGGSDLTGQLPWKEFSEAIKKIKNSTKLKISVHTGLIEAEAANALKDAGVDQVLIDVIGANETLREVYNLNVNTNTIYNSLVCLFETGLCVIPHILIGIHYGKLLGEYNALMMLKDFPVSNLVLVILNPIHGTPMAHARPVSPPRFTEVVKRAKEEFPEAVISLGCARPRDKTCFLYEKAAIDCGIDKVAFPTEQAIDYAKKLNMEVIYEKTCCSY